MIEITGAGGAAGRVARGRARGGAAGFAQAAALEAASQPADLVPPERTEGIAAPSLGAMLSLQETGEAAVRDREARRQALALLASLAALQHDLLRGGGTLDPATLRELAASADGMPQAADPVLAAIVHGIVVRVRVELARHPDQA